MLSDESRIALVSGRENIKELVDTSLSNQYSAVLCNSSMQMMINFGQSDPLLYIVDLDWIGASDDWFTNLAETPSFNSAPVLFTSEKGDIGKLNSLPEMPNGMFFNLDELTAMLGDDQLIETAKEMQRSPAPDATQNESEMKWS